MKLHFQMIKQHIPGILGLIAVLTYLSAVFGFLHIPIQLAIVLILAIGPVAIYGIISIGEKLYERDKIPLLLKTGIIYGFIAFGTWVLVHTIQQGGRIFFREKLLAGAADENIQEIYRQVYQAVNTTQATMDIGFDIFYCLLIIIFSYYMYNDKKFGRFIGVFGIFSAGGLLVINLWAFPFPPGEAGLYDLGPLTGVWWILVIIRMLRKETVKKSEQITQ